MAYLDAKCTGHNFDVPWEFSKWLHIIGGLGPFLAALITTYIFEKKTGVNKYFEDKLFRIQSIKWTLIGLGMPVAFFLIAVLILGVITGNWVDFTVLGLNTHESIPYLDFMVFFLWIRRRRRLARTTVP